MCQTCRPLGMRQGGSSNSTEDCYDAICLTLAQKTLPEAPKFIAPRALARPLGPCCAAGLVEVGKIREGPSESNRGISWSKLAMIDSSLIAHFVINICPRPIS